MKRFRTGVATHGATLVEPAIFVRRPWASALSHRSIWASFMRRPGSCRRDSGGWSEMMKSGNVTFVYFFLCSLCLMLRGLRSCESLLARAAGTQLRNGFLNDRCSRDLPQVRAGLCCAARHEPRSAYGLSSLWIEVRVPAVPRGVVCEPSQRVGAPLSGSRYLSVNFCIALVARASGYRRAVIDGRAGSAARISGARPRRCSA